MNYLSENIIGSFSNEFSIGKDNLLINDFNNILSEYKISEIETDMKCIEKYNDNPQKTFLICYLPSTGEEDNKLVNPIDNQIEVDEGIEDSTELSETKDEIVPVMIDNSSDREEIVELDQDNKVINPIENINRNIHGDEAIERLKLRHKAWIAARKTGKLK